MGKTPGCDEGLITNADPRHPLALSTNNNEPLTGPPTDDRSTLTAVVLALALAPNSKPNSGIWLSRLSPFTVGATCPPGVCIRTISCVVRPAGQMRQLRRLCQLHQVRELRELRELRQRRIGANSWRLENLHAHHVPQSRANARSELKKAATLWPKAGLLAWSLTSGPWPRLERCESWGRS